jgi:hypothetical protein
MALILLMTTMSSSMRVDLDPLSFDVPIMTVNRWE